MNADWTVTTLGEVCELYQPKTISKKEMLPEGEYPVFGANGVIGRYDSFNHAESEVLITCRGATCGSVNRSLPKSWITGNAMVAKPKGNKITKDFLEYFARGGIDFNKVISTAQPQITRKSLAPVELRFPPLPEQKRIVAILDEAFAAIDKAMANTEKNLANARELFENHLQSVFTQRGPDWVEKPLGQLSEFKNGLNYDKNSGGQTLPVVGVADFQENYFVPISELQSATIDGNLAENYAIRSNDILTVRSNGSKHLVGRCMLVGNLDEVVSYSGFIIRIRFDAKAIFPQFLLHYMKCKVTRDLLIAGGGGANITNINQKKLSALPVPLPPYRIQGKIAAALESMLEETQRLASIYEQKLSALEALKKSMLHQAFIGEL